MALSIRLIVGRNIKRLRARYGYTQERLSEAAEMDYKYLQKIEGKTPPAVKVDTLEKIAKVFNVNTQELLCETCSTDIKDKKDEGRENLKRRS